VVTSRTLRRQLNPFPLLFAQKSRNRHHTIKKEQGTHTQRHPPPASSSPTVSLPNLWNTSDRRDSMADSRRNPSEPSGVGSWPDSHVRRISPPSSQFTFSMPPVSRHPSTRTDSESARRYASLYLSAGGSGSPLARMSDGSVPAGSAKRQRSPDHNPGDPVSTMPLGLQVLDSESVSRPAKRPKASSDADSGLTGPRKRYRNVAPAKNPQSPKSSKKPKSKKPTPGGSSETPKSVDPPEKPKSLNTGILPFPQIPKSIFPVVINSTF
jgi:hypothetical protein